MFWLVVGQQSSLRGVTQGMDRRRGDNHMMRLQLINFLLTYRVGGRRWPHPRPSKYPGITSLVNSYLRRHLFYIYYGTSNVTIHSRLRNTMPECTSCGGKGVVSGIMCPDCGGAGQNSKRSQGSHSEVSAFPTSTNPFPCVFVFPRIIRLKELATDSTKRGEVLGQQANHRPTFVT